MGLAKVLAALTGPWGWPEVQCHRQPERAGLLPREEAFELIRELDGKRPDELDYYLEITGYTEEEFENILKAKRTGKAKDLV